MDAGTISSFYTVSSNQHEAHSSISTIPNTTFLSPHSRTHDTSGSIHHLEDFSEFVEGLNQSAKRAFPNQFRIQPRYKSIEALLLRWEQDDLNVDPEVTDLQRVLEKYSFGVETWFIPTNQSHRKLMLKVGEFVDKHESKDHLMIVYYGGHAFINESRQSTWCCKRSRDQATLDWSAVQTLFESATSDVLLLLDCCSVASSAPRGGAALIETIAACGWESIAAEPGRFSFTNALIEVLDEWINRKFSVAMLHSEILSVLKHERPELLGGTRRVECRRTPVYIVTTEDPKAPSITLSRMASKKVPEPPTLLSKGTKDHDEIPEEMPEPARRMKRRRKSSPLGNMSVIGSDQTHKKYKSSSDVTVLDEAMASFAPTQLPSPPEDCNIGSITSVTEDGSLKVPHVLISIALVQDQIPDVNSASEWLASFPV